MTSWYLLAMEAPLFDGDILYNSLVAFVLLLAGSGLYFKTGNRLGWVLCAVALYWAFLTYKELLGM